MDIIQSSEAFRIVGGKLEFNCVKGIVRYNGVLFFVKWRDRQQPPPDLSQLYDVKRLETDGRGPEVKPSWTVASGQTCYTCEILKKHPHPNVASYYGTQETRGRVSGLSLNKSAFLLGGRPLVKNGMEAQLDGILGGIRHLHSLGLVHNDITPANIMLEEDGILEKCFVTRTQKGRMDGTTPM
ncbi:hypothetical protein C8A03DRAFT_44289 [Achaetomium macrosporum]|uniref:EKC/KEOPS complex subunit BUD32 n=1 Tax=Achaetomium macrosporum TaxID=79813 RepID=A0AAN7HDS1_9PEZI|nr:hypothetical protein C8A03DRAFT_44289 [Achaetomium macrosporum]